MRGAVRPLQEEAIQQTLDPRAGLPLRGGGALVPPIMMEQPIQSRRSLAVPLPVSPLPSSREPRSPFGSSALPTASLAVLVSPTRPTERLDARQPPTPGSLTVLVSNPQSPDAATIVAQPSPVSPSPSTCKSDAAAIVPVPRLLSPDARFPLLPLGRLPNLLSAVLHLPPVQTHPVAFRFEWSDAAARHNLDILKIFGWIWLRPSPHNRSPPPPPVLNFVPPPSSPPCCPSHHPLWSRFRERITLGAEFLLTTIAENDRRTDLRPSYHVAIINRPEATRLNWLPC